MRKDTCSNDISFFGSSQVFHNFFISLFSLSPPPKGSWKYCFGADSVGVCVSVSVCICDTFLCERYLMNKWTDWNQICMDILR